MKNVLLLGDSIRINYQSTVTRALADVASVHYPGENCRFAKYTLCCLTDWLKRFPTPDLIYWNNGIWEINRFFPDTGCFTSEAEYVRDILAIHHQLQKTGAVICFATTTPVVPLDDHTSAPKRNADIDSINRRIVPILAVRGVHIHDLNAFVKPHAESYISEDTVHLSALGIERCGEEVARFIRAHL